jgi:hypothetical protein
MSSTFEGGSNRVNSVMDQQPPVHIKDRSKVVNFLFPKSINVWDAMVIADQQKFQIE